MDLRATNGRLGRKAATVLVVVGIVAGSIVGLDEWADGLATHPVSGGAVASAADGSTPAA